MTRTGIMVRWSLIACTLVLASTAAAESRGHLYVLPVNGTIERFPLTQGIPAPSPDLVFADARPMFAASEGGTFYAQSAPYRVDAFALGSNEPERQIDVPRILGCGSLVPYVQALAADPQGRLFVTITSYLSGASHRLERSGRDPITGQTLPCDGYLVYGPHARGHVAPIFSAPLGGEFLPSVSVDGAEHLYVYNSATNAAERYTTPLTNPTLAASFTNQETYTLTVDLSGRMFLDSDDLSDHLEVAVYPPGAKSQSQPSNVLLPLNFGKVLAARGQYIYQCPQYGSTVDIYPATANGPQNPVTTLSLPSTCWYDATGP